MNRPKLLFVAEELAVNGAVISLLRLLKNLPQDKYDISLFVFNHEGTMIKDIADGVTLLPEYLPYKIHRLPLKDALRLSIKKLRPDLALYRLLVSVQRAFKLDYLLWPFLPRVKGDYNVAISFNDGFTAPMILRKTNAHKKVCWIHFTYSNWQQPKFVYKALNRADCCVPVSSTAGKDLDSVIGHSVRKLIVHNIIDAEECLNRASEPCELPKSTGVFRIVSVGRVTRQKSMDLYPQTAQILKDRGISFEWYIVGGGGISNELINECREKGVDDCLHFIGSRQNCMPWIKSADVFVNVSRYEAWGMTASEALVLGTATVVSDIPVFSEQITHEYNGLTCTINPQCIADAIGRILSEPELKERLKKNALTYPFTKECIIDEFNHMIENVIHN